MVPARVVLYMLSFSGFLVSFMMRTDINIAMVAMAKLPSASNNETDAVTSHCYTIPNASHAENITINRPEVRLDVMHPIYYIAHNFFFRIVHFMRVLKITMIYFSNGKRIFRFASEINYFFSLSTRFSFIKFH